MFNYIPSTTRYNLTKNARLLTNRKYGKKQKHHLCGKVRCSLLQLSLISPKIPPMFQTVGHPIGVFMDELHLSNFQCKHYPDMTWTMRSSLLAQVLEHISVFHDSHEIIPCLNPYHTIPYHGDDCTYIYLLMHHKKSTIHGSVKSTVRPMDFLMDNITLYTRVKVDGTGTMYWLI